MSSFIMLKDGSTLLTSFQIINEGPQRALVGVPGETCWSARFRQTSPARLANTPWISTLSQLLAAGPPPVLGFFGKSPHRHLGTMTAFLDRAAI